MRCTWFLFFMVGISCSFVSCLNKSSGSKAGTTVYIYEDSTAEMTSNTALRLFSTDHFKTFNPAELNAGFTQSVFWIAFTIDSLEIKKNFYSLHIGNSHINIIKVYHVVKNHPQIIYTSGDYYPFTQRPLATADFNFPLHNPGTYLAMIDKHNESLQLNVSVDPTNSILEYDRAEKLIISFLSGMVALMSLFGIYLFIITRQRIYIFYVGFILSGWLWVLSNLGLGMQYLWPSSTNFASKARLVFSLSGLVFAMHFMILFTGGVQKTFTRKLIQILSLILLLLVVLILSGSYAYNKTPIWLYFQVLIPVAVLSFIVLALAILVYKIYNGDKKALFFLFSVIVLAFAGVADSFYYIGSLDGVERQHIKMALPAGFVLQVIILTAGLVYRFNMFRLQKESLLEEINRKQIENTRTLLELQEAERSQVADQLHDVAGSVLSAARLNLTAIIEEQKLQQVHTDERILKSEEAIAVVSDTIRNLSHALSPVMLDKVGFKTSLEKIISIFNASGKIKIQLITLGFDKYIPSFTSYYNVLYSIIYEALNNIIRHSGATHAIVQVTEHSESFTVVIEDNGKGINAEDIKNKNTIGLHGIKSKVMLFNGQVAFDNNTPKGLVITIEIPLKKNDIQDSIS